MIFIEKHNIRFLSLILKAISKKAIKTILLQKFRRRDFEESAQKFSPLFHMFTSRMIEISNMLSLYAVMSNAQFVTSLLDGVNFIRNQKR